ncbi:hypothetical protein [Desulfosarcina ovata]|uniref:Uncharacterized protein n=1 Tax=Desulfosarcina ovata subsp. ovata TaxID=2752305 RepID=A0A5K8AHT7_9BACT|nr:hypothetical protein [Desulfosarcina ovata]BBO92049.1 hypothetical protein DSCOOX_52290 [Desulfosarcina ovata subsp. ovata]
MLNATIIGAQKLKANLKAEGRRQEKDLQTATKVESYRLRKELKAGIRSGSPGGKRLKPLTFLARRKRDSKRFKPNKPLARLAVPIFYHVKSKNPFEVAVGWTGPRVSKAWKAIAEKQQEGFTRSVTDPQESYFRHRGEEISEKSKNRKFFFLRKSTTQLDTPARKIIDPFWQSQERRAWANIRANFRRKMMGKRI